MSHRAFFKGMTIGIFAGAAIGAAVMPAMHEHKCSEHRHAKHKCTKRTGKILRTAGDIFDHITGMFY